MSEFKSRMTCEDVTARISLVANTKVAGFVGYTERRSGNNLIGVFRCSCGTLFESQVWNVVYGKVKSCGCMKRGPKLGSKHRATLEKQPLHPLRETWNGMRRRCHEPTYRKYPYYGGRGIKVCDRWLNSFQAFVDDMGPKPTPEHTVERINNDGDYEPTNCRWATMAEQAKNRRPRNSCLPPLR